MECVFFITLVSGYEKAGASPHTPLETLFLNGLSMLNVMHTRVVTETGGGPDKTILNSPRFLEANGVNCFAVYMYPTADPGFSVIKSRARKLGCRVIGIPDKGFFDFSVLFRLYQLCKKEQVDVWHGHDYKSNFLGLLIRLIYPMKLVSTNHGWGVKSLKTPLYHLIDRMSLRFYQKSICVSKPIWDACVRAGVPEKKLVLIENGIDTEFFKRQNPGKLAGTMPFQGGETRVIIGSLGRLSKEKCFPQMVEAVDELMREGYSFSVRIAGEGQERSAIEKVISQSDNRASFELVGFIEDTRKFLKDLNIFILYSSSEGLPNAVLEALAMEVPVIATSVGDVPKLIRHGQTGLLSKPHDKKALKTHIIKLATDPKLCSALASQGRAFVEKNYSFKKRMDMIFKVYSEL